MKGVREQEKVTKICINKREIEDLKGCRDIEKE